MNKGKILIVEDEAISVAILTNILNDDYDLYVATNGQEALEKVKEIMPDIILLDIGLPGMNGYEVIRQLKMMDDIKEIPVIFTTAHTNIEDEKKGLQLGAADYIIKPYAPVIAKLRIDIQMQIVNQIKQIKEQIKLTSIDHLTGLYNRYFFDMQMNVEWKRALRKNTPISILMIDIDKFKNYNDTYGHLQGDIALKTVANVLKNSIKRPGDYAARWGGEEFVTLLPETDVNGALHVAEQMRTTIENTVILTENSQTKVTISVGACTHVPTSNCLVDDFIKNADKSLYEAKEEGHNRVKLYMPTNETDNKLLLTKKI